MRKMIAMLVALLTACSAAHAVEPGSIFDSPANWTPKTWLSMCAVCALREQNACRPDWSHWPDGAGGATELPRTALIRCNACAARECLIKDDAATRSY